MVVGNSDRPAAFRSLALDGDVATECDEGPASDSCRGGNRAIARKRLGGRAEIELDAGGHADGARRVVKLNDAPAGHDAEAGLERRTVAGDDPRERTVVSRRPERATDGRIDETTGALCRPKRDAQRGEKERADLHGLPTCPVDARELAVRPEAAAGEIDGVQLSLDCRNRVRLPLTIRRRDDGGRPEGAERNGHEPPDATTGGADTCVGGAAGGDGAA